MFFMSNILAVLNDGVIPIINQFRLVMECFSFRCKVESHKVTFFGSHKKFDQKRFLISNIKKTHNLQSISL